MSDQPLTLVVLAQFHRQVILPDIERVVGTAAGGSERRLRDEMHALQDFVLARLDRLEIDYEAFKAGLRRLEDRVEKIDARLERVAMGMEALATQLLDLHTRLGHIEGRLEELVALEEKYPVRVEVEELKARVALLHEGIGRLEKRLKG